MEEEANSLVTVEPNIESALESMHGFYDGTCSVAEKKAKYLSYRACGFTIRESIDLVPGLSESTLRRWRKDDENFKKQDGENLPILRRETRADILNTEFSRNYRLVLMKDHEVISKSLDNKQTLNEQEHQYLMNIRKHYTPQQLAIMKQLVEKGELKTGLADFSFSKFVMIINQNNQQNPIDQSSVVEGTYEEITDGRNGGRQRPEDGTPAETG